MRPLTAQLRAELTMIFTNGETVLLTLGIPVVFLLFFSGVHVLPTGTPHPVDFLVPGILALAVMSTAMTALGIGTGFDRGYGVLKRLGTTPLGRPAPARRQDHRHRRGRARAGRGAGGGRLRPRLEPRGTRRAGVRWSARPSWPWCSEPSPSAASGCLLAGQLEPLVNLAVVNSLFVVLLLLGGMLIPLAKLPGWLAAVAKACRPRRWPTRCTPTLGRGAAVAGRTGSCWWCGRWRRRWPPG